ncbi:hypothetical protein ACNQHI_01365 [Flavobacterium sp. XS2P14]
MEQFTQEDIDKALVEIETLDRYTMCKYWRFAPPGTEIYFLEPIVFTAFHKRLFIDFGGFTPEVSKQLGH